MPTDKQMQIRYQNDLAPVEKWKIDPELLKKAKQYRKLGELSSMLKRGITIDSARLTAMAKALYDVEQKKDTMLQMMNPTPQELDGQPVDLRALKIQY